MTDLAIEYNDCAPHFTIKAADIWVEDDHHIIARYRGPSCFEEEWCRLFKEHDCWWITRRFSDKKETSSVLNPDAMNLLDEALSAYVVQKELLE